MSDLSYLTPRSHWEWDRGELSGKVGLRVGGTYWLRL